MKVKRQIERIDREKWYRAEIFGRPIVSQGGWADSWMTNEELQATHDRAIERAYADAPRDNDYPIPQQCGGCRFFAAFNGDWGICCNPESAKDLTVSFEHGGCDKHSEIKVTQ